MGAWGHETFENDAACDWIYELIESKDPLTFIKKSLKPEDQYIESDNGVIIIAAAEVIYSLKMGPRCKLPNDEIVSWLIENKDLKVNDLCPQAIKSLTLVISDQSELNQLWSESEKIMIIGLGM